MRKVIKLAILVIVLGFVGYLVVAHGVPAVENMMAVKVAALKADPARYEGRHVRVDGIVVTGVGLFDYGKFRLRDTDGNAVVDVVTDKLVPAIGTRTTVTGVFKPVFVIGGMRYDVIVAEP